jgi:hypothetical protein
MDPYKMILNYKIVFDYKMKGKPKDVNFSARSVSNDGQYLIEFDDLGGSDKEDKILVLKVNH